jgi:hypothetical protein
VIPSDELRHAFPEPDARFQACVRHTLDALAQEDAQKERFPMKRPHLRVGVLIAAAVLLLSTIGVAAASWRYGLFDFLQVDPEELSEALAFVQTQVPQTQAPQAGSPAAETSFSLREAVYDGGAVHLVVEARPASDEVLLIGPDCLLTDPASSLGLSSEETIADYAKANGKTEIRSVQIVDTSAATGGEGVVQSLSYRLEGDGTLVFLASGAAPEGTASLPVELVCLTYPLLADGNYDVENGTQTDLSFSLERTDAGQDTRSFSTPVAFAGCGVTVERVEFTASPLGIYYAMECTVTDEAAFAAVEEGLFFRFLDADGEAIPLAASIGSQRSDPADGRFTLEGALAASDALPASLTIQAYDAETKEVYDTQTLR